MLTKESAATAADELISQQSSLRREAADARAFRVSFLYVSKNLLKLPPAERLKTIQSAQKTVCRRRLVMVAPMVWVLMGSLFLFTARPITAIGVMAFAWLGLVLIGTGRTLLVRREIRRLISAADPVT